MSRTQRFLGGVALGYAQQLIVTASGLWLTPFFLRRIGQHDFGLWLIGLQVLTWLTLMDFGIVALLPREAAYAVGRASSVESAQELAPVVARAWRVVLWQWPFVAIAASGLLFLLPSASQTARGPIAFVLAAFTLSFPLRVFRAVLEGIQDLVFLGRVQILTWAGGTLLTVCLVFANLHLYALAGGWAATQLSASAACIFRLRRKYPWTLPSGAAHRPAGSFATHVGRGLWVSVGQVAQVLLGGTDMALVGKTMGSATVVPYSCTGKLISVLANQPAMLMHAASPGLAAIKSSGDRAHAFEVAVNLTLGMLTLSGAVVCTVLIINRAFVSWWVGPQQFAGLSLTSLLVVAMILRHWNTTAVYSIFCFGYERRISVTTLVDGMVSLAASAFLLRRIGLTGAPIGSILGVCIVSLPANLHALSKESGKPLLAAFVPLWPWLWRFLLLAGGCEILANLWNPGNPFTAALTIVCICAIYVAVMLPMLLRSPISSYLPKSLLARRSATKDLQAIVTHPTIQD